MSSNLISTSNFKKEKLSLGNVQNKKSREEKIIKIFQFFMMEKM